MGWTIGQDINLLLLQSENWVASNSVYLTPSGATAMYAFKSGIKVNPTALGSLGLRGTGNDCTAYILNSEFSSANGT